MKTCLSVFAATCLVVYSATGTQASRLKIVTTTSDLAAITEVVTAGRADVHAVCSGKEDPHALQARPGIILLARDADAWIRVGLELEIGWEQAVLDASRNNCIRVGAPGYIDASAHALILDKPTATVTRAMGDVHLAGNPHYLLDPLNGRRVAVAIAERLGTLRPEHADKFRAHAVAFQQKLDERMFGAAALSELPPDELWRRFEQGTPIPHLGGWAAAMAPLRGKKIITYHRSWVYFAKRFGLEVLAELEPKPGVPPTAAHLAKIVEEAKAEGVKIVLQEPFYNRKAADRVADQISARVVVVANSVGGEPEASDYLKLMDLIVQRITDARSK